MFPRLLAQFGTIATLVSLRSTAWQCSQIMSQIDHAHFAECKPQLLSVNCARGCAVTVGRGRALHRQRRWPSSAVSGVFLRCLPSGRVPFLEYKYLRICARPPSGTLLEKMMSSNPGFQGLTDDCFCVFVYFCISLKIMLSAS